MRSFLYLEKLLGFDKPNNGFEIAEAETGTPPLDASNYDINTTCEEKAPSSVSCDISVNYAYLYGVYKKDINPDINLRKLKLHGKDDALAVFMTGMVDGTGVNDFILRPAMQENAEGTDVKAAEESTLPFNEAERSRNWKEIIKAVNEGKLAFFINGCDEALILDTRGYEKRSVEASENEKTVLGAKEAFTENLRTNITLLRRILKTEKFVCEFKRCKAINNPNVTIAYLSGSANELLINEIRRRVAKIKTRGVLDIGTLVQLMGDGGFSIFPKELLTEKPDRVASHLLNGHIAVLMDGSPIAAVLPITLFSLMSSAEDSYARPLLGGLLRFVRYVGVTVSILLPAYFLALALYHQGLLTTEVLYTIIASRRMVFASIGTEMVYLLFVFQLIREAGMRVPGSIGQAIGIIGGLILGQAAVAANLASTVVLIIVALTGLGNFCVPDYSLQIAVGYVRIMFVIAAWIGGLLGLVGATVIFLAVLSASRSYGVPYLAPFIPKTVSDRPFLLRGKISMHKRTADYMNTDGDKTI